MTTVSVNPGPGLARAAAALRGAGPVMRREFEAALDGIAKKVIADARANAVDMLPSRGGLAGEVATSRFKTERLGGAGIGRRITVAGHDPRIDTQGRVRHPVFGGDVWVTQRVTPGWFNRAAERARPAATQALERAAQRAAAEIGGA